MIRRMQRLWLTGALALLLAIPAIANGFPLIFPDSGTYLVIAFGREYAIDRSSIYGLLWKPFVNAAPGTSGLWLALAVQLVAVAAVLVVAMRRTAPTMSARQMLVCGLLVVGLTSLPWHAGQIMPDAFAGPVVLLACLAAARGPAEEGAPLLWTAAALLATTHYTHPVLLGAATAGMVAAQIATGLNWRAGARRLLAGATAAALALGALTAANGIALGRWTPSPMGGVFLFARAHEDGLAKPWFDRHCGRDAPAELCAARGEIADDSQALLWGDGRSLVGRHIWHAGDDAERWRWVEMMTAAVHGAIREAPLRFLRHAAAGMFEQLGRFAAIDDECPTGCRSRAGGIAFALDRYRPESLPALMRSMQVRDTTPKPLVRAVSGITALAALGLLPVLLAWALRRRDGFLAGMLVAVGLALVANAAMAGALSDVHDRYQSRVIWLVPFVVLLGLARLARPGPVRDRRQPRSLPACESVP
jgi:hypothetical protein